MQSTVGQEGVSSPQSMVTVCARFLLPGGPQASHDKNKQAKPTLDNYELQLCP